MGVRINRPVTQGNVGRSTSRPTAKKKEGESAKSASSSDSVALNAKENAVAIARAASSGVNEVDEAKVAEIREKIASGEYHADLKVVAERLIAESVAFSKD